MSKHYIITQTIGTKSRDLSGRYTTKATAEMMARVERKTNPAAKVTVWRVDSSGYTLAA